MKKSTKKVIELEIAIKDKIQETKEAVITLIDDNCGDLKTVVKVIIGVGIAAATGVLLWSIIKNTAAPKIESQIGGIGTYS